MNLNTKRLSMRLFLWLSLGNAVAYGLFHTSYLLAGSGDVGLQRLSLSLEAVRGYASELWEYLLLALIACFAVLVYSRAGVGAAAGLASLASLSRVFYSLPYYYMYFISLGYESIEALPLSLLVTLLMILATLVLALALALAGLLLTRLFSRLSLPSLREALSEAPEGKRPLAGAPQATLLLSTSALLATVELAKTVIRVWEFLSEYGLAFDAGELLLMLFELVLPLLYATAFYFLTYMAAVREFKKCTFAEEKGE